MLKEKNDRNNNNKEEKQKQKEKEMKNKENNNKNKKEKISKEKILLKKRNESESKMNDSFKDILNEPSVTSSSDHIPYYQSISLLKSVCHQIVPYDSIVTLITAVHYMERTARRYAKKKYPNKNIVVNGDSLFPIVVYCVLQSGFIFFPCVYMCYG